MTPAAVDWLTTLGIIGTGLAGIGAIFLFMRKVWPAFRRITSALYQFVKVVDSVSGLPAFIERTDCTLAAQNVTLAAQDSKIEDVHHETQNNDGSSLKDTADRTELAIKNAIMPRLDRLSTGYTELRGELESLRSAKTVTSLEVTTQKEPS